MSRTHGRDVPAAATDVAERAFSELGLAGLALAGGDSLGGVWALSRGWADLDRAECLTPRHRFPASSVTELVTATAVLRLVTRGRVALDVPANRHLLSAELADPAITVRELLCHTGGVDEPTELLADSVPDSDSLFGPVIRCGRGRGLYARSNGGLHRTRPAHHGRDRGTPGGALEPVVRLRDRRVHVAPTNRDVPVEPVNGRLLRALG